MAKYIKDLPVRAKVKFGKSHYFPNDTEKLKWIIVSKDSKWCTNGVTLFSEYAVDYRYLHYTRDDAKFPMYRYGDNMYNTSHINEWLNSDAGPGEWCKNTLDPAQTTEARHGGFLYCFSSEEKQSILTSNIYYTGDRELSSLSVKVYLPSAEVFNVPLYEERGSRIYDTVNLQDRWEAYLSYSDIETKYEPYIKRYCRVPDNNFKTRGTICRNIPSSRTHIDDNFDLQDRIRWCSFAMAVKDSGEGMIDHMDAKDQYGIRPVININANTKVSNTTDSEGYYTVIYNTPPTKPSYIRSNTSNILGGNTATISWGTSSDPDGDPVKYVLQRRVNNGGWSTITSNLRTTSYTDSITFGWNTVQYRVAAYDNDIPNDNNSYTLSSVYSITNNTPPTISGADKDLGTFSNAGTTIAYTISDRENNAVTVNISIDGKSLSNTSVTLGKEYKINLTGEAWITLNNGRHSVKIEATDSQGASATRTYTFIKSVTKMTFMNKVPYSSTNMPGRAKIYVNRQIPTNAIFKVYACNNAFDANPTWEDVTSSVTNNLVFMFTNKTKTATNWGVKIKVVVDRNNTAGECYISEVGGNFA